MTAGTFHRPTPAPKPNAFEQLRAPSIFMTPAELARQAKLTTARRKRGRPAQADGTVQIVYSKKGPR